MFLLVSARHSSHFPVLRRVVYIANAFASICAPMGVLVWKQGVFRRIFGALLSRGTENRLPYRPTQTWSKVNGTIFIFLLFKERVSRKCTSGWVHNKRSICLLHTGTRSSTQTCQILKTKRLRCKIILLCRLHKYKNVIHVIIDCHCVYKN